MKTFVVVTGILTLVLVLACVATGIGLSMAGFSHPHFTSHINGVPNPLGAALGLFIAAIAIVFALAVTVLALAGAFLAVMCALVFTGLILLAVALPFLLPLIIPLMLILVVVLASKRPNLPRTT